MDMYNYFPENFREISEKEFINFGIILKKVVNTEIREMFKSIDGSINLGFNNSIRCKLFYFIDGTGFVIYPDMINMKVRYYLFGCNHDYKIDNYYYLGKCENIYKCTKCGYVINIDSSD